jgi:putative flavoprotein involved in K+ transport
VWYDHLPYIPFPEHWPIFTPKDKLGDFLENYTKLMELNYWGSTECLSSSYDEGTGEWTVRVMREGQEVVLKPKELVLATGMSGKKNVPVIEGQDVFAGEQQHSSQHPGPDAYVDKKIVVIGSNNSSFDICGALAEAGADVTMLQRSSTCIVRSETLMDVGLGDLYSERAVKSGITTERADLIFASVPYAIMHDIEKEKFDRIRKKDAGFYDKLKNAGFMLDFGDDDSGTYKHTYIHTDALKSRKMRGRKITSSVSCLACSLPDIARAHILTHTHTNSGMFMKYLRRGSGYTTFILPPPLCYPCSAVLRCHCSAASPLTYTVGYYTLF